MKEKVQVRQVYLRSIFQQGTTQIVINYVMDSTDKSNTHLLYTTFFLPLNPGFAVIVNSGEKLKVFTHKWLLDSPFRWLLDEGHTLRIV